MLGALNTPQSFQYPLVLRVQLMGLLEKRRPVETRFLKYYAYVESHILRRSGQVRLQIQSLEHPGVGLSHVPALAARQRHVCR